jgi:hypothetical protein
LSGLGFNRAKRSLRWPVLSSAEATKDQKQTFNTAHYGNPRDFLSFILSDAQVRTAGLYASSDAVILQIVSQFNDYRQNIGVTQKNFGYFSGTITQPQQPLDYILAFLKTLPPVFDPKNETIVHAYNTFIEEFGTDVTTNSHFGGVIYLLAAIKACYGGSITGDIEKEISHLINGSEPAGPYAYLKYRKLGIYDVKGGNVEYSLQSQTAQRIASMEQNPVLISFDSIPLWQIVPAPYQEPLKAAIAHYLSQFQPTIEQWVASAEAQKIATFKAGQSLTIYHGNTEQCCYEAIYDVACPRYITDRVIYVPRFTIPRWSSNLVAGQANEFLSYPYYGAVLHYAVERDSNGLARLHGWATSGFSNTSAQVTDLVITSHKTVDKRISFKNSTTLAPSNNDVYSPYVHTGCTDMLDFYWTDHPEWHTFFKVCMDCQSYVTTSPASYGLNHYDVQCACGGF